MKEGLLLRFTSFLIKNSKGSGADIALGFNEQLAKELHEPIIRNF